MSATAIKKPCGCKSKRNKPAAVTAKPPPPPPRASGPGRRVLTAEGKRAYATMCLVCLYCERNEADPWGGKGLA